MKALLAKQKMINKVVLIPEHRIKPNPYQPRRVFDQEKIEQLAASIAQYGLLQPITVLPLEDGSYQLVAGERRLLACRRLRMQEVPAILTTMDEERSSALALVENIQRCDLNFFEEAAAIQKLMKMGGYTQQAVAKKLGKNQSTIANKLRLLQFSEPVREAILAANLTERHARALLNLNEQGDEPLLGPLAEHPYDILIEVQRSQFQTGCFGNAQSAGIHHLQNAAVAQRQRVFGVGGKGVQECIHLGGRHELRQDAPQFRGIHDVRDIGADDALLKQIAEKDLDRHEAPCKGRNLHSAVFAIGQIINDVIARHRHIRTDGTGFQVCNEIGKVRPVCEHRIFDKTAFKGEIADKMFQGTFHNKKPVSLPKNMPFCKKVLKNSLDCICSKPI